MREATGFVKVIVDKMVALVKRAKFEHCVLWILFLVIGFLLFNPLARVLTSSLTDEQGGATLGRYVGVFSDPSVWRALYVTAAITICSVSIAAIFGVTMAWMTCRVNVPFRASFQLVPVIGYMIPPLVGSVGWAFLLAPQAGLLNILLRWIFPWFGDSGPMNIYSVPGMIWVMALYLVPYIYLFSLSGFAGIDPSVEEASRVSGVGILRTAFKVTLPLILPAMFSGTLLATVLAMTMFSIPIILGAPAGINVVSVVIYKWVSVMYPPKREMAAALSVIFLFVAFSGVSLHRIISSRGERYATIRGKGFRALPMDVGRWRYLAFAVILVYLTSTVVLPILGVIWVSFSKYWTPKWGFHLLTISNFVDVLTDRIIMRAIGNSMILALSGATLTMVIAVFIAFIVMRTKVRGRGVLDYLSMAPAGVPGTVLGMGCLVAYLNPPLVLYGTLYVLLLAYICHFLPQAGRATVGAFQQLGSELEEASLICGASKFKTVFRITVPIIMPAILAGWMIVFILCSREVSASILLVTGGTRVISTQLVDMWEYAIYPVLAAFSVIILIVSTIVVVLSRLTGRFMSR